jgi:MarR family transcriptional regulator for hemolysin
MRYIRHEMRTHRHARLSVPQFRALVFVSGNGDASLSALAEHLGLSLPTASRMVDLLVRRGLLERHVDAADRRRVALALTARGRATYQWARRATQTALAGQFAALSAAQRGLISQAMRLLNRMFSALGVAGAPRRRAQRGWR